MTTTDTATYITEAVARRVDTTGYDIQVTLDDTDPRGEAGSIAVAHNGQVFWKVDALDVVSQTALTIAAIRDHQAGA